MTQLEYGDENLQAALFALVAWVEADPANRSVVEIDKPAGKWLVRLKVGEEVFTAGADEELRGAIRNGLTIAACAGQP
jgi:transcription elongation GreA/GreB family factor